MGEELPAVAFAAKSTKDKRGSIPDQLKDGRDLAEREGLTVMAEFKDEDESAYSADRGRGLAAAMKECERLVAEHGTCALIVQHSDRLARGDGVKAKHLVEYALWALKTGVKIRSVQDDQTFADLLYAVVTGQRNHEDSRRKGLAVRDGLMRRAKRGKLAGGPRPYGYRWVARLDDQGRRVSHLVVVPVEAEVVKRIYAETIRGVSQRGLARVLTNEGVPTTSGSVWVQGTVSTLIRNPLYMGKVRHRGEVYPGVHEAIVSAEVWERAQEVREARVRRAGGRWPKGSHLCTRGLLRCGRCGWALIPRTDPGRVNYEVYECHGRRTRGVEFCSQGSIRRELIDTPLLDHLTRHYIDLDETRRQMEERAAADLSVARQALAQAEAEAAAAEAKLTRVRTHYQEGRIEPEDWREQRPGLVAGLEAAQKAVLRAQEHVQGLEARRGPTDSEQALLQRLATIRSGVADVLGQAPDLNTLRLTLSDLFESFELIPWPGFGQGQGEGFTPAENPALEAGGATYALLPRLRWSAVDREAGLVVRKAVLPLPEMVGEGFER
jgi:DNA invertase Pin-like site-specific DNA recombinase